MTPQTVEEHPAGATVAARLDEEEHRTAPIQKEDKASSNEGHRSIMSERDVSGNDGSESEGDTEDGMSKQETLHELGSSRS